ncbi:MAG: class I SAM-dependent methyltransferase [Gammaproteobacteria bacterium]
MANRFDTRSYRQRIYDTYVQTRDTPLAPDTLAGFKPRLPYLRQLVRKHFPSDRDAAILELGCGHGALLHVLAQAGYAYTQGVDTSPEQVAAAQKLGIEGVEQGDVMAKLHSTGGSSLDVVVAFDVIEHFTKPELIFLVDEVRRVLKPGGRWIIHVPNAESPFGARIRYSDITHEQAFTHTSLAQLLLASGFASVRCYEDRPVAHGIKSMIRSALWECIRLGLLFYIAIEMGTWDSCAVFSQNLLAVARKSEVS